MKTPMIHHFAASGIVCLFLLASAPSSRAEDDLVADSLTAAQSWVAQIDAGEYQNSYDSGDSTLHDKTKADIWLRVLKTIREPWGDVVSRKEINHEFKPDGYEGADGQFMVITYSTSFKKLPDALEVVVLKLDDGRWRGAGYNLGPKPSSASNMTDLPTTTDVESATVPLHH